MQPGYICVAGLDLATGRHLGVPRSPRAAGSPLAAAGGPLTANSSPGQQWGVHARPERHRHSSLAAGQWHPPARRSALQSRSG